MASIGFIAIGAISLGLLASIALARLLTKPIDRLSTSLAAMARSRDLQSRLPITGSSREVDGLTETFNSLMASVAAAEAQMEEAYTGAIRALAAALDARDPYTAGHSDRVSVLSVAIGRVLGLPADDLEVLRLGAMLHDIGKIGVPDEVLRKPGALTEAEFDVIRQHPVLGARILRSVPFLSRAHPDRRTPSRTAGRPRLSARPSRRRHPDGRTHRSRGRRVRRDHERPCLSRGTPVRRRAARSFGAAPVPSSTRRSWGP